MHLVALGLSFVLLVGVVPEALGRELVGATAALGVESPRPYPDGDATLPVVWSHTLRRPGATFLKLHFARFELGAGDVVRLLDGAGAVAAEYAARDDARGGFWTRSVEGDTVTIELRADGSEAGAGVAIDRYGYGISSLVLQSICGTNQQEDIACYAGTPVEVSSRAVGRLVFEDGGAMFACTGFLVSERDHLLTAQHCIGSQAAVDSLEVTFDYQLPSCGDGAPARFEIYVGDRLVLADPSLDVALLTLKGEPASQHGFLPLSRRALAPGEALYLPQHPRGGVKKVSVLGCEVSDPQVDGRSRGSDFGHQCDTEPGSSGAPVLDLENQVVGLHRFGGCTVLGGENQAVRMSRALPALPAQRTVLALESGRLDFDQGGAMGLLRLKARLTLGLDGDGIAPLAEAVTLTLGDGDGAFYSATIRAGAFRREGKSFLFADPLGSVAGGLRFLRLAPVGAFTYLVGVGGRRIDFSGADRDDITVTLTIGDDTAFGTAHFERRPRALVLP